MGKNEEVVFVENNRDWKEEVQVLYKVEETPPVGVSILLGFQVVFTFNFFESDDQTLGSFRLNC